MKKPRWNDVIEWWRRRNGIFKSGGRSRFSPWMLNLLLLPLFAFDLQSEVRSLLRAMDVSGAVEVGGAVVSSAGSPGGGEKLDLTTMTQWHPFGSQVGPGGTTLAADTRNLPDTSLNFQLHGILFIDGTRIPAFALIKLADAPEKVFAVGEEVTGGVWLYAVESDRVILDRGGRLEALKLPRAILEIRPPDA
ncbi:MAG: hypothetical protein HQL76_13990 [Magnetococcales bacterium]|nr:hypothetical protein [Magnetococcales bacterium]